MSNREVWDKGYRDAVQHKDPTVVKTTTGYRFEFDTPDWTTEEMLEYAKSYCEGFNNYSEEYDPAEDYAAKDIEKDY